MLVTAVPQEEVIDALNEAAPNAMVRNVQAVDITFYDAEGNEIEPATAIRVKMSKKTETPAPAAPAESTESVVMHVDNAGSAQIVENATVDNSTAEFESDSFSKYIFADLLTEEVLDSLGNTYTISVTYGPEAKIPEYSGLEVSEILETSEEYREYVARTESALGMGEGTAGYIRLFDIKIEKDGEKIQPADGTTVDVKIELKDAQADSLSVVHFADESDTGSVVQSTETEGQTVSFTAEGFSVYAIIGTDEGDPSGTKSVKFEFYYGAETNVQEYSFVNEDGETTSTEYVTYGEYLVNPGLPAYNGNNSSTAQAFLGWCYATVDGTAAVVNTDAVYDFTKTLEENLTAFSAAGVNLDSLEKDEFGNYTIKLLGVYNNAVYVYYFSEKSAQVESSTYDIYAINLIGEDGTEDFTATDYVPDSSSQAFLGWSTYTPAEQIANLGSDTLRKFVLNQSNNVYGGEIHSLNQDSDGSIAICGGTDAKDSIISLYPVVADVYWVTYDKNDWIYTYDNKDGAYDVKTETSNPGAGMYIKDGETYVYANGTGDWDLTFEYVGAQQGTYNRAGSGATYVAPVYVLQGESLSSSENNGFPNPEPERDGYTFGGWYADEALTIPFSENAVISNVYTLYNGGNADDHALTLYAKWVPKTTTYTVAIWLENADDNEYSYVTSFVLRGNTMTSTAAGNFITNGGTYYTRGDDGTVTEAGSFSNRTALLQSVFGSEVVRYNNTNHTYYEYTYYDYENPTYTEATIAGDGSTVVNVYYDRNEYTVRFYYGWGSTSGGTPEYERVWIGFANNGTISGITGTQGNYYYTTENGNTRVYWRNNYFRSNNSNNGTRYTGNVWERVQTGTSGGTTTYYISTTNTDYTAFGSTSSRQQTTQSVLESVEGYATTTSGTNTIYYFDLTAKYGADLTDLWPTKILTESGEEISGGDYSFISWLTDADSVYRAVASSNANIKGTYSSMDKVLITKTNGTATTAGDGVAHIAHARFDDNYYSYKYYYYLWDPNTTSNTVQYTASDISGWTSATHYPSGLNSAPVLPDELAHFDTYLFKDEERNSSTSYSGDWTTYVVDTRSAGYIQQQALMEVAGYTRVAYTGYLGSGGYGSGSGASDTSHTEGHMYFYFWPNLHELNFMDGGTTVSNTKAYYVEDISDNSDRSTVADTLTAEYMERTYGSSHPGYEFVGWFADSGCGTYVFFHEPTASEVTSLLNTMVDREEISRYTEITAAEYAALSSDEQAFIYQSGGSYYRLNYMVYTSMPDSGLTFYAGWRPLKYRVWIQPNGGQLATNGMSTYFNNTYQQLVGKYDGVQRNYVPATTPQMSDDSVRKFAYVYVSSADYKGARIALYVYKDGDKYYYYDYQAASISGPGTTPIELSGAYLTAAQETGQLDDADFKYVYKYNGYALVGWYKYEGPETVQGMESGSSAPTILSSDTLMQWNFGEGITENTAIRAIWKRTGYLTVVYQGTGYQLNADGTVTVGTTGDTVPDVDVSTYRPADYTYADNSQGVAAMTPTMTAEDATKWIFMGWITPDYQEITSGSVAAYVHDPGQPYTIHADYALQDDGNAWYEGDDQVADEYHFYYVLYPVFMQIETTAIQYKWTDAADGTMTGRVLSDYGDQLAENTDGTLIVDPSASVTKSNNSIIGLKQESAVKLSDGSGFTRTGYKLIGWNDDEAAADAGTVKYLLGGTYGISKGSNTLYAVWESYHITVTKNVVLSEPVSLEDVNMTAYFAINKKGEDTYLEKDGAVWIESIQIVNGVPQTQAIFEGLEPGTYEVWEVADEEGNIRLNPGHYMPGSRTIQISQIATRVGDNTTNNVAVGSDQPGDITITNTFSEPSDTLEWVTKKAWYPRNNYQSDHMNTEIPGEASVEFTIFEKNSDTAIQTITLDGIRDDNGEDVPWEAHFLVPKTDDEGNAIQYVVRETGMNYTSEYQYFTFYGNSLDPNSLANDPGYSEQNGGSIKNIPLYARVLIYKHFEAQPIENLSELYGNLSYHITGPYGYDETVRLQVADGNYSYHTYLYDVPAGIYTVEEIGYENLIPGRKWYAEESGVRTTKPVAGENDQLQKGETTIQVLVSTNGSDQDGPEVRFENNYRFVDIPATKVWDDDGTGNHPAVTLTLYRRDPDYPQHGWSNMGSKTIPANATGNDLTVVWSKVEQINSTGKVYEYKVEESPVDGYEAEITGDMLNGFTVTNTPVSNISMELKKLVNGSAGDQNKEFSFSISVKDASNNPTSFSVKQNETETEYSDGQASNIKLKHNDSVTITVPANSTVVITESDNYGYVVTASGATDGVLEGNTYTCKAESGKTIVYTNTREGIPVYLNKVDKDDQTKLLPNAEFKLYRKDLNGNYATDETIDATKSTTTHVVTNGTLQIENLPSGDYKLVETKAPAGYVILTKEIYFTVNASATESENIITTTSDPSIGASTKTTDATGDTLVIPNTPGVELPSTGGRGTGLFTAIGAILSGTAGAILTLRKRKA